MILVIDHYDSFTFNLVQALGSLGHRVVVIPFDSPELTHIKRCSFSRVVLSPGPGRPEEKRQTLQFISEFYTQVPILGICLGHQALGFFLGGKVRHASRLVHGKSSRVFHDGAGVFSGLDSIVDVGRYHSLVLDPECIPEEVVVSARTQSGTVMGIRHRELPLEGIQFHPESVLTPLGVKMLENFIS